ncbi:MAG: HAMP domain-containing histidine kinase [Myxococcales bacterium]|nr:HAMP domain-containing histidine kinase [Myxococcales bacterium]
MTGRRATSLGLRLALGASLLVATTAAGVAWGMVDAMVGDLHRALELRSEAVARGLAQLSAPALGRGDDAGLAQLLGEVWDVEDVARVEVRDLLGRAHASRVFDAAVGEDAAVVVAPITGEPDEEGFRDAIGTIRVVLSGRGNAARRLRYLQLAARVSAAVVVVGLAAAFALAWALVRPLRRLQTAASALAAGQYAGDLPDAGPREVQRLGAVIREAIAAVAAREAELNDANDRLRRTEEAREAMTHMLVHDLRGPLSNLLMLLDVVEGDVHPDDRPLLAEGRARCQGLLELIQDLLAMSRIEAGHVHLDLARGDVATLVGGALDQVGHLARQRRFDIQVGETPGTLVADQRLLQRVLVNLLLNAMRHGRSPAQLDVEAADEALTFVVRDAGGGVPAEAAERIFEKFQRAGSARGGAGLGLAFVRLVARAHGGDAWVEGARFAVRIPRTPPEPA